MRTQIPKLMLLGLGGGIAAYMFSRRHTKPALAKVAKSDPMAADPADPVQGFDELNPLQLDALDVDAMSHVDADADVDAASREVAMDLAALELDAPESTIDSGLYEVATPRAQDRTLPDDDAAMADGQNWVEALETSAAENGPMPEASIDAIADDDDLFGAPPPADPDDLPVADRGSGGPAGI